MNFDDKPWRRTDSMKWTIFEYLYRDAGIFIAFGSVALEGRLNDADRDAFRAKLISGEFFVAEQIGVPPLYEQLYQWSDGPTASDHCWHEFVGFRESGDPERCPNGGNAKDFVARVISGTEWDLSLSPHSL
jgi:hypothetical protein